MAMMPQQWNDPNQVLPEIHYNPLQSYRNVTYNTRLTMMPRKEATQTRADRSYDFKKGVIMWETAGTGAVYLEEMTIETVGTGSASGTYAMQQYHKFSGKLVEPLGGRFIESIAISALRMGYPNTAESLYMLEISFVGHDIDGDTPVICKGWEGEELTFRWYVKLLELKMKLDYKGSTYDFEMMPSGGHAQQSEHLSFESSMKVAPGAGNIGAFLKSVEDALNKREKQKVDSGQRCAPHIYKLYAHPDIKSLPMKDYNVWSALTPNWFKADITAAAGTNIQQFLLGALGNSKEIMKYLHRVDDGKKDYNSTHTKKDTIHLLPRNFSIISGSVARAQDDGIMFDNFIGTSAKEIIYYLTTKEDAKNIIGPLEFEDAWNPVNRKKRVDGYLEKGLLRKAYKWIYTGENTEVISCDIKIDHLWRMVRPQFVDSDGTPVSGPALTQPAAAKRGSASQAATLVCKEARMIKVVPEWPDGKINYSEDALPQPGDINPTENWWPHMPTTAIINTQIADNQKKEGAMSPENATEYSVYRQLGNSQGQGSADLMEINLEVVGDPYFLFQVPGGPAKPPLEEDVWEYILNDLTETKLAETRKKTATHNWLPFIYFEAQVPSNTYTDKDLVELRPADTITGIYSCKKVTNKFFKGKFTTTLDAYRDQLVNPYAKTTSAAATTPDGKPTASGKAAATAGKKP